MYFGFRWDGKVYFVNTEMNKLGGLKIILPIGKVVQVDSVQESYPPQIGGISEVKHRHKSNLPEKLSMIFDGAPIAITEEEAKKLRNK